MEVYCGIDWAEDHHDIALADRDGTLLARRRISDDAAGLAALMGTRSLCQPCGPDSEDQAVDICPSNSPFAGIPAVDTQEPTSAGTCGRCPPDSKESWY
jgi:hypothetical protein